MGRRKPPTTRRCPNCTSEWAPRNKHGNTRASGRRASRGREGPPRRPSLGLRAPQPRTPTECLSFRRRTCTPQGRLRAWRATRRACERRQLSRGGPTCGLRGPSAPPASSHPTTRRTVPASWHGRRRRRARRPNPPVFETPSAPVPGPVPAAGLPAPRELHPGWRPRDMRSRLRHRRRRRRAAGQATWHGTQKTNTVRAIAHLIAGGGRGQA
mmetsp:Transcript_12334/g.36651  ORF Transcript_12334/g.36651 Transcript_12334/m.36651 type:complete len:212 (+) Transcript_12334:550-1185(+)